MREHAFSLIETLVVVAIVAILSTIGFVYYQGALDNSELKLVMPEIVKSLDSLRVASAEKKAIVEIEFIDGTPRIRYTVKAEGTDPIPGETDFKDAGLRKGALTFRDYRWPDGARKPRTYTFFPNGTAQGGRIEFGSAWATKSIHLIGNRLGWED